MAQKTTYTILGIPGQKQSFVAKTSAETIPELQRDVLMAAGILTDVPELAVLANVATLPENAVGASAAAATLPASIAGPLVATATLPTREIGVYLATA